jgi:hypothetical protein
MKYTSEIKKAESGQPHESTVLVWWLSPSLHRHLKTDLQKTIKNNIITDEWNLNIRWIWQYWQSQQYNILY